MRAALLVVLLVASSIVPALRAQEVGVRIRVGDGLRVSLDVGEADCAMVLRALQDELRIPIEFSESAGLVWLKNLQVRDATPAEAILAVLKGADLGYALLWSDSGTLARVVVVQNSHQGGPWPPATARLSEVPETEVTTSQSTRPPPADLSVSTGDQATSRETAQDGSPGRQQDRAQASYVPVSEAAGLVFGATAQHDRSPSIATPKAFVFKMEPAASRPQVLPLSQAPATMGVPRGAAPEWVGVTIVLPLRR